MNQLDGECLVANTVTLCTIIWKHNKFSSALIRYIRTDV